MWGEDNYDYTSSSNSPYTVNELFQNDPKDKRRSTYQINKSAMHKVRHQIDNRFEEYDTLTGFDEEESHSERIERVLLTFYKNDMTDREKAEMVVDAHEHDDDWGTGSYNKGYYGG